MHVSHLGKSNGFIVASNLCCMCESNVQESECVKSCLCGLYLLALALALMFMVFVFAFTLAVVHPCLSCFTLVRVCTCPHPCSPSLSLVYLPVTLLCTQMSHSATWPAL
jgi:hypothetical protein